MIESAGRRRLVVLLAVVAGGVLLRGRLERVGGPARSHGHGGDRGGDRERPARDRRAETASHSWTGSPTRTRLFISWGPARWLEGGPDRPRRPGPGSRPDSRFAARAIFGRMQLQMERGRFSEAEQIIRDALDDPRVDAASLPILLGPIYCHQGRLAETLRLIETRWDALNRAGEGASELAINLVRAHIDLQQDPMPLEVIRSVLDQAASLAPDDDRVWLGKANLAIRTRIVRRGEAVARCLSAASSRGHPGLARPAGLGGGDESRRGGAARR